jgi:hypothetical protein
MCLWCLFDGHVLGIPFDYHAFDVSHNHHAFVSLLIHQGLVFLLIAMVLVFLPIVMVLVPLGHYGLSVLGCHDFDSSWSLCFCVPIDHYGLGAPSNHCAFIFFLIIIVLVFLIIIVVLAFLLIGVVLCSCLSSWSSVFPNHCGFGVPLDHHALNVPLNIVVVLCSSWLSQSYVPPPCHCLVFYVCLLPCSRFLLYLFSMH